MASFSTNDSGFSYASAPVSPDARRVSNVSLFYSTPANHCRDNACPPYNIDAGKLDPIGSCEQTSSDSDLDFEFDTSWRCVLDADKFITSRDVGSPLHKKSRPRGDSLPSMAFADELFCDGKVMPLKPPLCSYYESKAGNQSPVGSPSPRSPRSGFKVSFHFRRRSRWNDDFDPFIVALENVKGDSRARRATQANDHRRTRSLSPFRGFKAESPRRSTDLTRRNHQDNGRETPRAPVKRPVEPVDHTNLPFSKWAPKKQAGLQHDDQNPIQSPKQRETHGKVGEGKRENGECLVREIKRQRIWRFLLRTTSSGPSAGRKEGNEKVKAIWMPKVSILRRYWKWWSNYSE